MTFNDFFFNLGYKEAIFPNSASISVFDYIIFQVENNKIILHLNLKIIILSVKPLAIWFIKIKTFLL